MDTIQPTLPFLQSKQCRKCGIVKPRADFSPHSQQSDRLHPRCKPCKAADQKAYRDRNVELVRARDRKRYAEGPDRRERAYAYRKANPEATKAADRKSYYKNRESKRAALREWHKRHPEHSTEYSRKWRASNPERMRELALTTGHKRRARKAKVGGSFTAREFAALCDRYGNICLACGAQENLTADHVIPLSCGGSNDISNIQPLCGPCNSRKHRKVIDYRGKLDESRPQETVRSG